MHKRKTTKLQGTDNNMLVNSYNLYLKKCECFKEKINKHKENNLQIKNSILQSIKTGYKSSQEFENQILQEREQAMKVYQKTFNLIFKKESDLVLGGKSKEICLIRDLNEMRNENFSKTFDKEKKSWFSRYCILSRFIQAARLIIIRNRWKKVFQILSNLKKETLLD